MTDRYYARMGLSGKAISVVRMTNDGAQTWAWNRWNDIPVGAMPAIDGTMVDMITEAEALRLISDPEAFNDERGPDPLALAPA